ncbi:MAG: myxococcus cysteine-rich repeat containing protein [Candidatus Pacearchaeota archaeon]|nr:myxococcus cysteine-rich repeat containing protein [Candidatus Pacearchaeota archaeon]
MKTKTIKGIIFLVLTLSVIAFASALYLVDAGIRYSYPDSFGTGIAVSENGHWISNTPNLTIGQTHTIRYYIDNKLPNTTANVRITVRLDSEVIADYYTNITDYHTKTVDLDISDLACSSSHTIHLKVQDSNDNDCSIGDNCAQRNIIVSCGEPSPICGDGIKQNNEECDSGIENGVLCSAGYNSFCNYCSNYCEIEKVQGGFCGDGVLQGNEKCDDGNLMNGDGCSVTCKKEGNQGTGIGVDITTEDFVPLVWQCDHRIVYDDETEPGRNMFYAQPAEINLEAVKLVDGQELIERINNYAFEGEQIQWKVLVMDKNGIEKVKDVYATVGEDIEANCVRLTDSPNDIIGDTFTDVAYLRKIDPSCNARILEEDIDEFDSDLMAYYLCTLTVETPESMYGEHDITVEAEDLDGLTSTMAETESWFLNPEIHLLVDGELVFGGTDGVRPGTSSYSENVLVGNEADDYSGVWLDMFISGTDFYDSSSSGAKCGESNVLELENFAYYATNGAYSTNDDLEVGRSCDEEGYCQINYGIGFNNPNPFYDANEILQDQKVGPYYTANVLAPGAEMSLVFRLNLPEPCNGDFNTGHIYFWGEAV